MANRIRERAIPPRSRKSLPLKPAVERHAGAIFGRSTRAPLRKMPPKKDAPPAPACPTPGADFACAGSVDRFDEAVASTAALRRRHGCAPAAGAIDLRQDVVTKQRYARSPIEEHPCARPDRAAPATASRANRARAPAAAPPTTRSLQCERRARNVCVGSAAVSARATLWIRSPACGGRRRTAANLRRREHDPMPAEEASPGRRPIVAADGSRKERRRTEQARADEVRRYPRRARRRRRRTG